MVGWHHQLNGHEFEQVLGVGDEQGSLVCWSPWGLKETDMTEQLNWRLWLFAMKQQSTDSALMDPHSHLPTEPDHWHSPLCNISRCAPVPWLSQACCFLVAKSCLFATSWSAASQAFLSFTIFSSLLKLMSIDSVMPFNHLILCCPLLPPSLFPSIRVFSSELTLHIRWPKNWSFSVSINPSTEYSGLISFRIDWFDLLAVQGTLKSFLQHHSSKASILQHSAFFMVQLSHPYMTTGKTVTLTMWTFVSKVVSLLFNMLSRFVIALKPLKVGDYECLT